MDTAVRKAIDRAKELRAVSYACRCTSQHVLARAFVLRRDAAALVETSTVARSRAA